MVTQDIRSPRRGIGLAAVFGFWICVVGAGWPAMAQTSVTTGAIRGEVTDSAGGPISGATVTALRIETSQTWTMSTGADGTFRWLALPVGEYRITAEKAQFTPEVAAATLGVGDALDIAIVLQVAGVSEQVDVSGEAPAVDITRTQAAAFVRPTEIQSLPLNGRNYLDLALLTPGASRTNTGSVQRFAETSAVPGTGISIASQRNLNNTFLVDGVSANDDAAGLAGTFFSQEVIREFQVISNGGMAEFGRASGGIVNVLTQSGTNQWLGRGYGYFRDQALDARNGLTGDRDPYSQQQFGATLGGPLRRNRLFMFGNIERTRNRQTALVTIAPEVAASIDGLLTREGYAGPGVATGTLPTGYDTTNVFLRTDASLGSSRLTLRYSSYDIDSPNSRNVGGLSAPSRGAALDDTDRTVAMNLVSALSERTVNEVRAQFTTSRLAAPVNDPIGPAVSIAGVANFGTSTSSPTRRDLTVAEVSDTLSHQRGRHLLKFGADALLNRVTIDFPGALAGAYAFASLPDFDAGRYSTYQQAFGATSQFQSNPNLALFAQDEWQVRRSLTVNAGVRYDLQWLPSPIVTDDNNVSPRAGIAFAPGDRRTVIRASGGLYFDRIPLRATSNALQRDGTRYRVAVFSFGEAGAPAFPATLPAFPGGQLISITTIDPHIQDAVSRQAGVQVERQIGAATTVTAGYEHLAGRGLIMQINVNAPTLAPDVAAAAGIPNLGRPDPLFGNIGRYESIGRSLYNGLSLSMHTQVRRWLDARISYTYSRAYDDAGNFFFSQPQDSANPHADWGPADNDQRHRLSVSGSITAPHASGSVVQMLRSDWRASAVFSYASALPFNVLAGADLNHDTNSATDRPAGVGRNSARGFDTATLDVRLSRQIRTTAHGNLELLIEAFNVLNRNNYLIPNGTYGTGASPRPTFGQPTAIGDPRQAQIGVRVTF
jgi:hypothetical protein